MNKRLLTLSMVGLLTATLTSCSDVSQKVVDGKQVIVTVGDESYTADDLLAKYSTTTGGVEAYYKAIYDVLIRDQQEITQDMETTVNTEIDTFTKDVKKNASTNGVTYKTELSNELKEKGVETLAELAEVYTLEKQKTKYEEDWYANRINWEDRESEGKDDSLTVEYIENSSPYHVKHILVKTEGAGTSLYDGTISEAEALKLSSVVKRLASGKESFGQVAQQASDDTTSAAVYGSIGIIDKHSNSGYVSEFKYGVYAYDAYFDTHTANSAATSAQRVAALNIPTEITYSSISNKQIAPINVKDSLTSIGTVPYTVIEQLEKFADKTKTDGNLTYVPNKDASIWGPGEKPANVENLGGQTISESYYPRNIIFNNYFNDHGLYVITKDSSFSGEGRWKNFPALSTTDEILVDEKDNPILVTRAGSGESYQGVHFMVIEQSPFWYDESNLAASKPWSNLKSTDAKPSTKEYLRYYYSTNVPSTSSEDVSANQKFVTFVKSNRTTYTERATKIESSVKAYDSNINYKLFETMYENAKSRITINETVLKSIQDMIAQKRATSSYQYDLSNVASWKSYVELLKIQDEEKETKQLDLNYIKMYEPGYVKTEVKILKK